jgi:Pyruvate/2-oxoacid:ferredoxin oxidoreductase delta subunit
MPAIKEEVEEAIAEGITIEFLAAPAGFIKDDRGYVKAMKVIRMELGEPDASGRRRPVPIEGSEYEIPASAIISAVSQQPDFTGFESLIEVPGRDWIKVDGDQRTLEDKVWAGGDVTNLALVTDAVGHGRKAAEDIDRAFTGAPRAEDKRPVVYSDKMVLSHYEKSERQVPSHVGLDARMDLDTEVNLGFTAEQLLKESDRCMSCGYCMDCEKCWMYCQDQAIVKPQGGVFPYGWKLENCTGCSKCAEICPCNFIEMH